MYLPLRDHRKACTGHCQCGLRWLQMRQTCFPSEKAVEAILSDRNGKSSCFFDWSRRKSGQLPVTLVCLPPFSVCSYLFSPRFQAVIQVFVPGNVYFCRCLLLFHNVSDKNCARLIIKCRNTGNWEVYQKQHHQST